MEIKELIKLRKSVRSWANKTVDRKTVEALIDVARYAPSAKNRQDWHIVAVDDIETRKRLAEVAKGQRFVGEAPVVLAVCGDSSTGTTTCRMPKNVIDASILIDHITLLAASEGLGTCWIGHFDQDACKELLGIPDPWNVVELLPLGYPADTKPLDKIRNGVDEILSWNRWSK